MIKIFKWAINVIVFVTFLNGLTFVVFGIIKTYHGYEQIVAVEHGRPGIALVESLDSFLIALVFLIFSVGFARLFHSESKIFTAINVPALKVESFADLKMLLWNTILLTLMVLFATIVVSNEGDLEWKIMILPVSIALLAFSSKILH